MIDVCFTSTGGCFYIMFKFDSVLPPPVDPPIMTWTIPQIINPIESQTTPFLPPSLTYTEPPELEEHPQRMIHDNYGMIPAESYGESGFNDLMGNGDGLSLGSPSSEGGSSDRDGMENSGISGCFDDHQVWVDTLDWLDFQMSEELFEN